jgi:hypothetical protein
MDSDAGWLRTCSSSGEALSGCDIFTSCARVVERKIFAAVIAKLSRQARDTSCIALMESPPFWKKVAFYVNFAELEAQNFCEQCLHLVLGHCQRSV